LIEIQADGMNDVRCLGKKLDRQAGIDTTRLVCIAGAPCPTRSGCGKEIPDNNRQEPNDTQSPKSKTRRARDLRFAVQRVENSHWRLRIQIAARRPCRLTKGFSVALTDLADAIEVTL
jgi:hypothetical protein